MSPMSPDRDKESSVQRSKRLRNHRNMKIIMKNGSFVVAQPGSEQQVVSDAVTSILSAVGVGKGIRENLIGSSGAQDARDRCASTTGGGNDMGGSGGGGGGGRTYQSSASFSLPHNADDGRVSALLMMVESDTAACHPLCVTCTRKECASLDAEIGTYEGKISTYRTYLSEIESGTPESALDSALAACLAEEKSLLERIDAVKRRRHLLRPKQAALARGKKRLAEMEAKYWTMYGAHQSSLARTNDLVHSLAAQLPLARARMAALSRTFVLDDAFPVRPVGHFASINGFRMGRFSNILVSWSEVNCACGYAALLLKSVAKALKLDAVAYSIVPMGSTPKILPGARGLAPLDLFYEGKMFAAKRFDEALAALLALTHKAAAHCLAADPAFAAAVPLPYKIVDDTIGNTSVRLQPAKSDHIWTCALKNLLTDLKWLVLWLSAHTI